MVDTVSPEKRSSIMRSIRGGDTSPEMTVRKAAHRLGLRFRLHAKNLPGSPDLIFPRWRTALFVNGCFWHRHPECPKTTTPKSNITFWEEKFKKNTIRDQANYAKLNELGWKVVIIWQCEVRTIDMATKALRLHFPHIQPQ